MTSVQVEIACWDVVAHLGVDVARVDDGLATHDSGIDLLGSSREEHPCSLSDACKQTVSVTVPEEVDHSCQGHLPLAVLVVYQRPCLRDVPEIPDDLQALGPQGIGHGGVHLVR